MIVLNQNAPAAVAANDGDGGHYYTCKNGVWLPLYEPGADFKTAAAKEMAARGEVVVPSVTTLFKAMAKPHIQKWEKRKVAEACWDQIRTYATAQPEDREEFITTAIATASGASRGAMDLGTQIHDAIEGAVAGKDHSADMDIYVQAVLAKRAEMGITTSHPEQCVGSLKYGYGGKCDDHTDDYQIIDYKSRSAKNKVKFKVPFYDTDMLQIAAYGYARFGNDFFRKGRGHIFGIATNAPGVVTVHSWDGKELIPAFEAFLSLCALWRFSNFDPRKAA